MTSSSTMTLRCTLGLALALGLAVTAPGCDGPDAAADADEFIALQRDFDGFTSWEHESLGYAPQGPGHPAGDRVIYINERPTTADELPVGTVIVKTMDTVDEGLLVLAMVKRGGDYNDDGAQGWEWFELALDDQGRPVIVWRGQDAPDGECYGCLPGTETAIEPTSCNDCHERAADQDYVYTALRLLR